MNWKSLQSCLVLVAAVGAVVATVAMAGAASAQDYPTRPITIIVPFPPGGSSDIVMRLVANKASETLKQTIVIENRPGAGGNVAAMAIKNAPPDGYLLMMGHTGTHAINPSLYADLKFDPIRDFQPITALIAFNNILVVPETSPAKSVAELVALAKTKPEGLSYGSQGVGTGGHLLGVLLAKHAGINLVHVPYRGIAPAVTDTVAGRMDLLFAAYLSSGPQVEAGKLRMLAIAGTQRHPRVPDLPTMPEAGYPEAQMQQWFGLFAPAGTPAPIVQKLNAEIGKLVSRPDIQEAWAKQSVEPSVMSAADYDKFLRSEVEKWAEVVRVSGAKIE
jgi:tripartite-type tricarboxylate transporter receptor subunit TctC